MNISLFVHGKTFSGMCDRRLSEKSLIRVHFEKVNESILICINGLLLTLTMLPFMAWSMKYVFKKIKRNLPVLNAGNILSVNLPGVVLKCGSVLLKTNTTISNLTHKRTTLLLHAKSLSGRFRRRFIPKFLLREKTKYLPLNMELQPGPEKKVRL